MFLTDKMLQIVHNIFGGRSFRIYIKEFPGSIKNNIAWDGIQAQLKEESSVSVKNTIKQSNISYLLELLKTRHSEIKSNVEGFMANLKKESIARV